MSEMSQTEETLIGSVANKYISDGYEVLMFPGPSVIPFDLGGYRPDLIARKGNLSLIVEVKANSLKTSFDHLRPLVEETRRHEGWRFVLVTSQDVSGLDFQNDTGQVPWEVIREGLLHADRLHNSGEHEAAYLILWIAFERMLRNRAIHVGLPLDRLAPPTMIRQLYSQGELTMAQFDAAVDCQKLRNRIVHGLHAADAVTGFERLRALSEELLWQWTTPSEDELAFDHSPDSIDKR